ncbi:hypothetical protein [Ruegeria atlantica]|uniref:hypothetical protein n=1 Tax=Ruegeria atlantica TaxID=81569 RepID=UPI00147A9A25|nr:hypothetical protein [Ruegeria atlantica]
MVRTLTYRGFEAVVGLTWKRAVKPPFWRSAPVKADWAGQSAVLEDGQDAIGKAVLFSILADSIPLDARNGDVLIVLADPEQDIFCAMTLVSGRPRIGAEQIFASREELLKYVTSELSHVARLFTTQELRAEIGTQVETHIFSEMPDGFEPIRIEGKLRTKNLRRVLLAGLGAGLAAVALGGAVWVQYFRPEPKAVIVPKLAMVVDRDIFAASCLGAFADEWPLSPGWELQQEGCATPDMRDPALQGASVTKPVAYRAYRLRQGYQQSVARKAAEAVYADSPVAVDVDGSTLFATKPIRAPLTEAGPAGTPSAPGADPAELLKQAEAVFLGSARSVTLPGGEEVRVRIDLQGSFGDAFERAARLDNIDIARLSREGETLILEIAPRHIRMVPVTEVDSARDG